MITRLAVKYKRTIWFSKAIGYKWQVLNNNKWEDMECSDAII